MQIMAHRGCSGHYPENTMLAFQKAVEAGCDGIELDVHETADGALVIIHDETLDRTTDGTGPVIGYTLEQLQRFHASKDATGPVQRIPTLEEYCAWAAEQPIYSNIEIKTDHTYYPNIERKIWETVVRYRLQERVMFSSFNHISLLRMRLLAPDSIVMGALVGAGGIRGLPGDYCAAAGLRAYHPAWKILNRENIRNCLDRGIEINAWTVNDPAVALKLRDWGCHGVITNYPAEIRQALEQN